MPGDPISEPPRLTPFAPAICPAKAPPDGRLKLKGERDVVAGFMIGLLPDTMGGDPALGGERYPSIGTPLGESWSYE